MKLYSHGYAVTTMCSVYKWTLSFTKVWIYVEFGRFTARPKAELLLWFPNVKCYYVRVYMFLAKFKN